MEDKHILSGPELHEELSNESVGQQLHTSLVRLQDLPLAFVDYVPGITVSFKEILQTSCCLANVLKQNGYSKGSVIGICCENNRHYISPLLAGLYLGCTITAFNPEYTLGELLHVTNISKPSLIFCSARALKNILKIRSVSKYLKEIVVLDATDDIDGLRALLNYIPKSVWNNTDPTKFKPTDVDPSKDVAFILYSSGTTGLPKGVMLTHRNVSAGFSLARDPRYSSPSQPETDTIIGLMPPFHIYGLFVLFFSILYGQIHIILAKFDPLNYLEAIQNYKVTKLYLVPSLANFIAYSPLLNDYNLTSVTYIGCSAAPLSSEIEKRLKQRFVNLKKFNQTYGMTESTCSLTTFYADDSKVGSCGQLVPGILAKVVDENGTPLGPRQHGELCFKGPLIMKGYAVDVKSTDAVIDQNGWLSTGDIGYYDEDEYFYIVDRIKELIKYKGYQVAPAELEALLLTHAKIMDVAVVGLPNEIVGEVPVAFVVKKPNQSLSELEVTDFVSRNVSPHKWLRGGVRFVQEIPKGPTGKILRRLLREQLKPKSKL